MGRLAARTIALCVFFTAAAVHADHNPFIRSFDAVPLKPTPSLNSGIMLEGADMWTRKSFRAALLFDFSVNVLALRLGEEKLGNLIPLRADAHLMFAYQVHERVDIGVDVPLVLYQSDNFGLLEEQGFPQPGVYSLLRPCDSVFSRGCGVADFRIVPRALILDPKTMPIGLAVIPEFRLPTGDGLSFTGDRGVMFAPRVAIERAFGPARVLGNLGYRFRQHGQFLNLYVGSEFTAGAGVIYSLPDVGPLTQVKALGEVHLATQTASPFTFTRSDSLKTPVELLIGARANVRRRWGVELSAGRAVALESGYGRPDFRVLVGLRYDSQFADRDGDGIPDDEDACPDDPEDMDGFEDSDGCPELDNDKDGVPDAQDVCPNDPGLAELDGCPDRDLDEVPDNIDKCPDAAGPPENEGCPFEDPPFVVLEPDRLRLRANVLFETGSARIQRQSYPILDEVAKVMTEHPDIGPVRVEGHTDDRGSAAYNRDLSQRRARSVMEYVVKKGIDRKRLRAQGFGEDRPIAPNDTALNRAKNRRVEFTIVKGEKEIPAESPAPGSGQNQ